MSRISLAFLGSGEFDPWSEPVERWLLARSRTPQGPVLVCATASAHEGDESYDGWVTKGLEHYRSLGVPAEVLPLKTREDAHRHEVVARIDDASAIFFSGGNPARLAQVVAGTPFWDALQAAIRDGLPYAGCSAGVACLTERTYDSDSSDFDSIWAPGIGYVRQTLFGPHWDIVDTWIPGATDFIAGSVDPGDTFIGLDEDTALVGDGRRWEVMGRAKVHVMRDREWARYAGGDVIELPLPFADDPA
ncbi:MAG TPA: Type 1 glutamine amidotransferase-like domain-containing protein [Actinomycetota bacterium]|nr:Type 1 glutamine amidotransferase-like domain-containing protein [Actinomycetota bacterium]